MHAFNLTARALLLLSGFAVPCLPAAAQERTDLTAALNRERQITEVPPLSVSSDLSRAADEIAMRALANAGAAPGAGLAKPDLTAVEASLLERFYIPMQLDVLVSMAGSDPQGAVDQWRRSDWPTIADPVLQEVGTAVLWNSGASSPNGAYIWVAVLARPLRTPAESAESPRYRVPGTATPAAKP